VLHPLATFVARAKAPRTGAVSRAVKIAYAYDDLNGYRSADAVVT
jgi:hypothetical protein